VSHWLIVPVVLPAMVAGFLVLALRHDVLLQRIASLAATTACLAVGIGLLVQAAGGAVEVYELGDWPAPFGIVFVLDRLSALMVVLTSLLGLLVLLYAIGEWDQRGRHFHALFQFQLMGLNGAFLTGDLFNLFVWFEVLLLASYGLMLHGSGAERLKAGTHYVIVNLTGSTLFLVAVAFIYGVTGTLNMADLAVKIPAVPEADQALLQMGGVLLLLVFGIKAALVPLHFWLPATYSATSPPVAALFAIMTKVGAYAIIRFYTLAFGADAGEAAWLAGPWLLPLALLTIVVGMVGALATRSLRWLMAFAVIGSMGTLLVAVAVFERAAMAGALYYLIHSTLVAASLFLLAALIAERRGQDGDSLSLKPMPAQGDLMAGLFFAAAIAMAGLPPLSGFIGKLLILDGVRNEGSAALIWATILITSLLIIVAFTRAGSLVFWKSRTVEATRESTELAERSYPALPIVVVSVLITSTALLTAFAGPVMTYLEAAALQLFEPGDYITTVLGPEPAPGPAPEPAAAATAGEPTLAATPEVAPPEVIP
jgi:multicomponent K+:H+ antiporter subunit D